jgi:hypothetical protein
MITLAAWRPYLARFKYSFQMQHNFSTIIKALKKIVNVFDEESTVKKMALLTALGAMPLPGGKQILIYHDLLLFTCAYPGSEQLKQLAEKELKRIAAFSKQHTNTNKALLENEGLPFANTVTK